MPSSAPGSMSTGSAWTTSTGCAGLRASYARGVARPRADGHRIGDGAAPDRRWRCAGCDRRVSATAGTIFHGTRTPLTVWFSAAWHLTSGKGGICATELQREMQLGSYQSTWAMLHRY